MTLLALVIFAVLSAVAGLHVYWAMGGLWPGRDVQQLADTVIGDAKRRAMPPTALTLLVAVLIFAAGVLPLLHLSGLPFGLPAWLTRAGLWALVLVFFGRGAVTYILRAQAAAMTEPFATLNRRYYSPLCLALGMGFLAVLAFS